MVRGKITFFDKIIGFFTATPPDQVARERHPDTAPKPPRTPKPSRPPRATDFDVIPAESAKSFTVATASMKDLEWVIMDTNEPQEVRRAAAERWAQIAPHPLRPHLPVIHGLGHEPFWTAFREAYQEQELW